MVKTLIFGHKSPDTDTICSAISYAYFKNEVGVDAEAVRLGSINKETDFALTYFNQKSPREIDRVSEEAVILVDHNEFQQSIDNIAEANIVEVIDHHRIANFETKDPILLRVEPVGCTATILKKIYEENNIKIPKEIAGLLLSAIISDSLLLKSPTCTDEDIKAAEDLAEIAEVNLYTYGLDMLKAGADLSKSSVAELITMDAKEFTMNDQKVEIAQVNAFDIDNILVKQAELTKAIHETIEIKELELFLFVVTDILEQNSDVLALGNSKEKVEKAFATKLVNDRAFLEGVVSRKQQIVTNLTKAFNY